MYSTWRKTHWPDLKRSTRGFAFHENRHAECESRLVRKSSKSHRLLDLTRRARKRQRTKREDCFCGQQGLPLCPRGVHILLVVTWPTRGPAKTRSRTETEANCFISCSDGAFRFAHVAATLFSFLVHFGVRVIIKRFKIKKRRNRWHLTIALKGKTSTQRLVAVLECLCFAGGPHRAKWLLFAFLQ